MLSSRLSLLFLVAAFGDAFFFRIFAACTTPEYKTLPIDEFEKVIAQPDVIVVDVRTPEEYAEGHIPGAINIDWKAGHFAEQAEVLLDKDKTIALYCIRARRSKFAAKELLNMGYKNVIELQDGQLSNVCATVMSRILA